MFYEQVKELAVEPFKRLTGVKPATLRVMVEALHRAERSKRKSGRPSKLSTKDQLLVILVYLRENCTYFHIGHAYRVNASAVYRIVRHVEDTLNIDEAFKLPGKKQLQEGDFELSFVIVDVTETPIERPKKSNASTKVMLPLQ